MGSLFYDTHKPHFFSARNAKTGLPAMVALSKPSEQSTCPVIDNWVYASPRCTSRLQLFYISRFAHGSLYPDTHKQRFLDFSSNLNAKKWSKPREQSTCPVIDNWVYASPRCTSRHQLFYI